MIQAACLFSLEEHPNIRRCLSMLCMKKFEGDSLHHKAVFTVSAGSM